MKQQQLGTSVSSLLTTTACVEALPRTELDFLHLLGGEGLLVANVALIERIQGESDGNSSNLAGVGHP